MLGWIITFTLAAQMVQPDQPPQEWIDEVERLATTEMGDVAGGVYSRVQVLVSTRGERLSVPAEGWVVGDGTRAVLWDGLLYPLEGRSIPMSIEPAMRRTRSSTGYSWPSTDPWFRAPVAPRQNSLMAAALWHRAGYRFLSLQCFRRWRDSGNRMPGDKAGPHLRTWLADRYRSRVVDAISVGDDRVALALLEVEARLRVGAAPGPQVGRLNSVEQIQSELRRRLENPAKTNDIIGQLENVTRLPDQIIRGDNIYERSVLMGDSIVPELIEAANGDLRLSRAELPSRNFPDRSLATVQQVAENILAEIWPESYWLRSLNPTMDLRHWWQRHRSLAPEERSLDLIFSEESPDSLAATSLRRLSGREFYGPDIEFKKLKRVAETQGRRIRREMDRRLDRAIARYESSRANNDLNDLLRLATSYAQFDFAAGRSRLYRESDFAFAATWPDLQKVDRWLLRQVFELGITRGDAKLIGRIRQYCRRPEAFDEFGYFATLAARNPKCRGLGAAIKPLFDQAEAIVGSRGAAGPAIRFLAHFFTQELNPLLKNSDVRDLLQRALENDSAIATTGQWLDELPLDRGTVRLDLGDIEPTQVGVSVADFTAERLSSEFETGPKLSYLAGGAARKAARGSVVRWLRTLGGETPVKRGLMFRKS